MPKHNGWQLDNGRLETTFNPACLTMLIASGISGVVLVLGVRALWNWIT